MQMHGISADMYTMNSVLALLSRVGQVDLVLDTLEQLRALGAPVDAFTYTAVLSTCARCEPSRPEIAEKLLRQATEDGVRWMPSMVNATLSAYGSRVMDAVKCWKTLRGGAREDDARAVRHVQTYEALLRVCGRAGRPDVALKIVYVMRKSGDVLATKGANLFHTFERGVREGGSRHKLTGIIARRYLVHLETECRAFVMNLPVERIRIKY